MHYKTLSSCPHFSLLFLLILCSQFTPHTPYLFNGFQVIELDGNNTCFINDSATWLASKKMSTNVYTNCAGTYLIGGYGVLGSSSSPWASGEYFYKNYTGLPDHNYIRFSFTIFALDTWDQPNTDGKNHYDAFLVGFDGLVVYGQSYWKSIWPGQVNVCGGPWPDLPNISVFGVVPHQGSTLLLKLISDLNEITTNESFGFRDLALLFDLNPPPSPQYAEVCGVASIPLNSNECTCPKGQYSTASGCQYCDQACDSCYNSTAYDCYRCASGYSWNGYACIACVDSLTDTCSFAATTTPSMKCKTGYVYFNTTAECYEDCKYPLGKSSVSCSTDQCTLACSLTQFTYWDQSCSSTCDFPLQQLVMLGQVPLCVYPCGSTDYLYWDGTCHHDCPPPFTKSIINTKNLCTTTCTASQFLYPDGSCQNSCPSPLISETIQGRTLCKSPCNTPGEYLYANGECSLTCDSLFTGTTTLGIQYCISPCLDYLYWNTSRLSTCPRPLTIRIERNQQYCDYPTPIANFLFWDGTNSAICNSPLLQRIEGTITTRKFCDYPCQNWEYLYADGSCLNDCVFPFTKRVKGGQRFCDYVCTGSDALFWNGSCIAASQCTPPLILASLGTFQLCQFPAGNTSNFLYWDGTFSETCDPPFTQRIEGSPMIRKFCDIPCSAPTPILNWDGQCIASCSSPYTTVTKGTKSMCSTPCLNSQYLYDNGTCQDDCIFPYIQIIYGAQKVCHNPCSNTNLYYYWNSSCLPTCDLPYQTQTMNGVNWCVYPCSGEQFAYSDGSCSDSCEKPLKSFLIANLKHCSNPCDFKKPYITQDGTCHNSCDDPMSLNPFTNVCSPPCPNDKPFYSVPDRECRSECNEADLDISGLYIRCLSSTSVENTSFLDFFLRAPSSSSPSFVSLARVVQYARYLDINFPTNLNNLFQSQATNIVTIRMGSSMSSEAKATFPKYSLPHAFSQYSDVHSSFVVNFWKELTSWLIGGLLVLLFAAFEGLSKKKQWTTCENIFKKLTILFKWNYLLIMIGSSLGQTVLFASLQLRTIHPGSSFNAFSLELCFAVLSIGTILLLGVIYLARELQTSTNHEKWRPYQVLYQGFNNKIRLNRIFYLLYAIRLCVPMLIASWFYFSPILQTILYNIISVMMLLYLWKNQPILRRLNQIQLVILESLVLFINAGLFLLTILDASDKSQTSLAVNLGDLIVFANTCINLLMLVFLIIKIVLAIKAIVRFNKSPDKSSHPWPRILIAIMQQGGFGFEEIDLQEDLMPPEDDFNFSMLTTVKGIKAKGRSSGSIRRNIRRIVPDSIGITSVPRRNLRIGQLFRVVEEDLADGNRQEKLKEKPSLLGLEKRKRRLLKSPEHYQEEEKVDLQGNRRNRLRRRLFTNKNERGAFLVELAEKGTFGNCDDALERETNRERRNQDEGGDVSVLIDPDLMKGVRMTDLKKMDLRDGENIK